MVLQNNDAAKSVTPPPQKNKKELQGNWHILRLEGRLSIIHSTHLSFFDLVFGFSGATFCIYILTPGAFCVSWLWQFLRN
jgi:hypothetical protein